MSTRRDARAMTGKAGSASCGAALILVVVLGGLLLLSTP
jgi:hypothetical protein